MAKRADNGSDGRRRNSRRERSRSRSTSSGNKKIGNSATTYAAQTSCPTSCPFFDGGGCYGEGGSLGRFVTAPLNRAAQTVEHDVVDVANGEATAIDKLKVKPGQPLRLHTVGDCASDEAARIVAAAAARYRARGGGPVWTYTSSWRRDGATPRPASSGTSERSDATPSTPPRAERSPEATSSPVPSRRAARRARSAGSASTTSACASWVHDRVCRARGRVHATPDQEGARDA